MSEFITNAELRIEAERLCDENDQLREENDKLREQVTHLRDDWESERDYADQMEAKEKRAAEENAKLRELLADTLIDPRDYCAKYGIDYDGWDSANDDIDRRLRELGIEVTDK